MPCIRRFFPLSQLVLDIPASQMEKACLLSSVSSFAGRVGCSDAPMRLGRKSRAGFNRPTVKTIVEKGPQGATDCHTRHQRSALSLSLLLENSLRFSYM